MDPVILFDIDGTLVRSAYVRSPIEEAALDVFEVESIPDVEYGGRTDLAIFREIIDRLGFDPDQDMERFVQAYYARLDTAWRNGQFRVLPGVGSLLKRLNTFPCELGVLTGNGEPAAKSKLGAAGLADYFQFGAYGNDLTCRNELARRFVREQRSELRLDEREIVIIGDTISDIECARTIGAAIISVATGAHSFEKLKSSKPDFLFSDFSDQNAVLAAISSISGL